MRSTTADRLSITATPDCPLVPITAKKVKRPFAESQWWPVVVPPTDTVRVSKVCGVTP